jgi:hypothetical protein
VEGDRSTIDHRPHLTNRRSLAIISAAMRNPTVFPPNTTDAALAAADEVSG